MYLSQKEKLRRYELVRQMMHEKKPRNAWGTLLAIIGVTKPHAESEEGPAKAVKCDLCRDDEKGPACVRICPTGAAIRVSPEDYFKKVGVGAF